MSQFLWHKKDINIDDTEIHFEKLPNKNIYKKFIIKNFLLQLLENERIISWVNPKDEYELTNDMLFSAGSAKTPNPYKMDNTDF